MRRILVAGATGHLGSVVLHELKERGYWARALIRDRAKFTSKHTTADEVHVGDLLKPETLRDCCKDIDMVFSCAGASLRFGLSNDRLSYRQVDYKGNKNLLEAAMGSGAKKFVYVSVFGAEAYPHVEYVRAHEDFVRALQSSNLNYTIVRPTGFFHSFAEILELARKFPVMSIGEGDKRTNPIHERDLAAICVEALAGDEREVTAGGVETYTRREIIELAFDALGKKPKIVNMPIRAFKLIALPLRVFDPRLYALMDFFAAVTQTDAVAPQKGTQSFKSFLHDMAKN